MSSGVESEVGEAAAGRSTFALLTDRTFGPYFFGNLTSNIGTWFQQITAAIVVFDLTGSAFMVGLVGMAQFGPSLLLAPWTGAAADRFDRRRLLIAAQSVSATAAALLAALTLAVGVEGLPGPWPVIAAALVIGLGNAFAVASQQALVPALVPRPDLDQAVALNSVTFNLARAVGPALGAVVLVAWGAGSAFALNAFSYLALIGALLVIVPRPTAQPTGARTSVWVGAQYLRKDRVVAMLLVGVAALGFGADPVVTLTPALAAGLVTEGGMFGQADALVGMLVSAFGIGAMLATTVVKGLRTRFGQRRVALTGLGLLAAGTAGLAAAPSAVWALVAMVLGGGGFLLGVTALTTLMHLRIPEELRGRIMALWGVAFLGSRPLAALLDGSLADLLSPRTAAVIAAGIVLLGAAVVARSVPAAATSA